MDVRTRVNAAVLALDDAIRTVVLSPPAHDALRLLHALAAMPGVFVCPLCHDWAIRSSNRQRICAQCRRSHPHQTVEYLAMRAMRPPKPLKTLLCPLCDDPFEQKAGNQVMCGRCRALHGNRSLADLLARRAKHGTVVTTSQILSEEAVDAQRQTERMPSNRTCDMEIVSRVAVPPIVTEASPPTAFLMTNDVRPVPMNGHRPVSSWWARADREGFSTRAEQERERMQRSKEVRQVVDRIIGEPTRPW